MHGTQNFDIKETDENCISVEKKKTTLIRQVNISRDYQEKMKIMILAILLVFALITTIGQAAPISGRNSSPDNSTLTPSANSSTNSSDISVLFDEARVNFISVYQEIKELQEYTVRHLMCIQSCRDLATNCIYILKYFPSN